MEEIEREIKENIMKYEIKTTSNDILNIWDNSIKLSIDGAHSPISHLLIAWRETYRRLANSSWFSLLSNLKSCIFFPTKTKSNIIFILLTSLIISKLSF